MVRFKSAVLLVTGLAIASHARAQTATTPLLGGQVTQPLVPMFTPDEITSVMSYWAAPGRYTVSPPDDYRDRGLWQVRLTVAGSSWIFNYNRARKVSMIPTQDASAANSQQQAWDKWIQSKVDRDRWEAFQVALQSNIALYGVAPTKVDKNIPVTEPPRPVPMPLDLEALAGPAPRFAEATVPMQHKIALDDLTLSYLDKVRLGNPKYAYYRFASGVMDEGKTVRNLPPDRVKALMSAAGLDDSTARIMMSVSMLEGGFDSINTYDTGFVSVGFIQFACQKDGAGSLGEMMQSYKLDKPTSFASDFRKYGIDIATDGKLDVLDPDTGAEYHGPGAALKIIDDKRLIAVFQRAGQMSDDFIAAQIRSAKTKYFPADDPVTFTLNGTVVNAKVSDVIKSEAGLATLMDRKVNTGTLAQLQSMLSAVADQAHAMSIDDVAKFEATIISAMKYRQNYLNDTSLSQPTAAPFEIHLPPATGKR